MGVSVSCARAVQIRPQLGSTDHTGLSDEPRKYSKSPAIHYGWNHSTDEAESRDDEIQSWTVGLEFPDLVRCSILDTACNTKEDMKHFQLQNLNPSQIEALCKTVTARLTDRIKKSLARLKRNQSIKRLSSANSSTSNLKSAVQEVRGSNKFAFTGTFGNIEMFHMGLDSRIGLPQPNLLEAMEKEHFFHPEADSQFTSANYATTTTIRQEWDFVCNPDMKALMTVGSREPRPLSDFLQHQHAIEAGLAREEVIAIRLFTGPLYMKYNEELRRNDSQTRHFVSTIHAIVSGVNKLLRVWKLPSDRKVYRGLQGMELPPAFWEQDAFGCRGGVEMGIMSTTPKRDIALQYATFETGVRPTIFEIEVGAIDKGAVVSWLSQYPQEEEVILPPLSFLEVVGEPHIEPHACNKEVLVVQLRLNVNSKSLTLEEIQCKRKTNHLSLLENLMAEASRTVAGISERELSAFQHSSISLKLFSEQIEEILTVSRNRQPAWYNNDDNYRQAVNEALDMKVGLERKYHSLLDLVLSLQIGKDSWMCSLDESNALMQRIVETPCRSFCKAGIMYKLRSGVESMPWDAITEGQLMEVIVPSTLSGEQAEIVWECLRLYKAKLNFIKIEDGVSYLTVALQDVLERETQSFSGAAIGGQGLRILLPALNFNPKITVLDFQSALIGDQGLKDLSVVLGRKGAHLQSLNLLHNHITDQGVKFLTDGLLEHSSLTCLNLGSNQLTKNAAPHLRQIFEHHTQLTDVDLSWTSAAEGAIDFAPGLARLKDLKGLDISQCWVGPKGMSALAEALRNCTKLFKLFVTICGFGDEGTKVCADLIAQLPGLKICPFVDWDSSEEGCREVVKTLGSRDLMVLIVKGKIGMTSEAMMDLCDRQILNQSLKRIFVGEMPHLSEEATEKMLRLPCNESVEEVQMTLNNFSEPSLHHRLASIPMNRNITVLNLQSNGLGPGGAVALASALSSVINLKDLDVSINHIEGEGCIALGPVLLANTQLERLNLADNQIGDFAFESLPGSLQYCTKLKFLDFSFNSIKCSIPAIIPIMQNAKHLTTLILKGNEFGTLGVKELLKAQDEVERLQELDVTYCGMSSIIASRFMWRFGTSLKMVA